MTAHSPITVDTAEPKTFAQIIAELTADHERHVALVETAQQRFSAWSDALDKVETSHA